MSLLLAAAEQTENKESFLEAIQRIGWEFANNTGLAIVRTIAFLVLGLIVIKIVQSITRSATLKSTKLDNSAATFIISVVTVILYLALAVVMITSLGFSTAGVIAGFSAVALAIALALKDSLGSLANGVIIIFTKPFKKGDYIKINEYDGLVQDIRLFNTKILSYNNEEIIIPNSEILSTKMVNYSAMPLRRVVIDVPVPYESDTAKIKSILLESITSYENTVRTPAPSVIMKEYGSSSIVFTIRAWVPNAVYGGSVADLRELIFNDLRKNGVEMPFDRLDVQIVGDSSSEETNKITVINKEAK